MNWLDKLAVKSAAFEKSALLDLALGGGVGALHAGKDHREEGFHRGAGRMAGINGGATLGGISGALAGGGVGIGLAGLIAKALGRPLSDLAPDGLMAAGAGGAALGGLGGSIYGGVKGYQAAGRVMGKPSYEQDDEDDNEKKASAAALGTGLGVVGQAADSLYPLLAGGSLQAARSKSQGREDSHYGRGMLRGAATGLGSALGGLGGISLGGLGGAGLGGLVGALSGNPELAQLGAASGGLIGAGAGAGYGGYQGARAGWHLVGDPAKPKPKKEKKEEGQEKKAFLGSILSHPAVQNLGQRLSSFDVPGMASPWPSMSGALYGALPGGAPNVGSPLFSANPAQNPGLLDRGSNSNGWGASVDRFFTPNNTPTRQPAPGQWSGAASSMASGAVGAIGGRPNNAPVASQATPIQQANAGKTAPPPVVRPTTPPGPGATPAGHAGAPSLLPNSAKPKPPA